MVKGHIIVEGLDCVGKTTLIEHIRTKYFKEPHTYVIKESKPIGDTPEKKINWSIRHYEDLFSLMANDEYDRNFILDRAHLGCFVYGPKYHWLENSDLSSIWVSEEKIANITILITLTAPYSDIVKYDDGNSIAFNHDDVDDERNRFIDAHNKSNIKNKLFIDGIDFDTLYDKVDSYLETIWKQ